MSGRNRLPFAAGKLLQAAQKQPILKVLSGVLGVTSKLSCWVLPQTRQLGIIAAPRSTSQRAVARVGRQLQDSSVFFERVGDGVRRLARVGSC